MISSAQVPPNPNAGNPLVDLHISLLGLISAGDAERTPEGVPLRFPLAHTMRGLCHKLRVEAPGQPTRLAIRGTPIPANLVARFGGVKTLDVSECEGFLDLAGVALIGGLPMLQNVRVQVQWGPMAGLVVSALLQMLHAKNLPGGATADIVIEFPSILA